MPKYTETFFLPISYFHMDPHSNLKSIPCAFLASYFYSNSPVTPPAFTAFAAVYFSWTSDVMKHTPHNKAINSYWLIWWWLLALGCALLSLILFCVIKSITAAVDIKNKQCRSWVSTSLSAMSAMSDDCFCWCPSSRILLRHQQKFHQIFSLHLHFAAVSFDNSIIAVQKFKNVISHILSSLFLSL